MLALVVVASSLFCCAPSGLSRDGRALAGSFGFIALDVEALLTWCPNTSVRAPAHIQMCGRLLQTGVGSEPTALPTPSPARLPPPRDRSAELAVMSVSRGWAFVQHFCDVFRLGSGNIKQACQRVAKRLRGDGFETTGYQKEVVGRPPKMARLRDWRSVNYPKLL